MVEAGIEHSECSQSHKGQSQNAGQTYWIYRIPQGLLNCSNHTVNTVNFHSIKSLSTPVIPAQQGSPCIASDRELFTSGGI